MIFRHPSFQDERVEKAGGSDREGGGSFCSVEVSRLLALTIVSKMSGTGGAYCSDVVIWVNGFQSGNGCHSCQCQTHGLSTVPVRLVSGVALFLYRGCPMFKERYLILRESDLAVYVVSLALIS